MAAERPEAAAHIAASRSLIKRALKQVEKALRALSAAYDGHDTEAVITVRDRDDIDALDGVLDLALAEHAECVVVVLTHPSRPRTRGGGGQAR